ncbi:hypothetical protein [Brevundimonas sp.]|uniref:hypothetical protein n=1 Tax=Brevundimonas sp. TaxID=1871086 RepID=UPI003D1503AF
MAVTASEGEVAQILSEELSSAQQVASWKAQKRDVFDSALTTGESIRIAKRLGAVQGDLLSPHLKIIYPPGGWGRHDLTETLLELAALVGPSATEAWFRQLLLLETSPVRAFAALHLLAVDLPVRIGNLTIAPLSELPDWPAMQEWQLRMFRTGLYPESVAFRDFPAQPWRVADDGDSAPVLASFEDWLLELEEVCDLIACVSAGAPSIGESLYLYTDPILRPLGLQNGWSIGRSDSFGRSATFDQNVLAFVQSFAALPAGDFRRSLRLSAGRVSLSKRRRSLADRAVDLSIAFEAILNPGHQDITYKLALRTALFVANTVEERGEIRDTMKRFYGVRSKVVHGNALSSPAAAAALIDAAEAVCLRLMGKLIARGTAPDWEAIELGARDPDRRPSDGVDGDRV